MKQQIRLCLVRLEQDRHRRVVWALRRALAQTTLLTGLKQQVLDEITYRESQLSALAYAAATAQDSLTRLCKRATKFQKLV